MADNDVVEKRQTQRVSQIIPGESKWFPKSYGLEFCCLLFSIACSNNQIIVQNFYIDRICRVTKNYSIAECQNLSSYQADEKVLEVTASEFVIYQTLIEHGFPILVSFFVGSWTDKHGSKPVFVVSLCGYFVSALFFVLFSFLPDLPPIYLLTASIPIALGGGLSSLLLSGISLITRQAKEQERNLRLGLFSVCIDGGIALGVFLGEQIFKCSGYSGVFTTTACLQGAAVICGLLFIVEKKPEQILLSTNRVSVNCLADFFDISAIKDTIRTCFKQRQNKKRRCIVIMMTAITLQLFSFLVRSYLFLFTRNKFGWDLTDYSQYVICNAIFNSIGGVIMALVAIKLLHIQDINLGFISTLSNLSGYLVLIFASSGWLMYLSAGVQMFGAITTAVMRSILSKCVEPEEHGKLFSFVTCVELAMPFVSSSIYGVIYMTTATTIPWAMFLLPVGIQLLIGSFYLYLRCFTGSLSSYGVLRED